MSAYSLKPAVVYGATTGTTADAIPENKGRQYLLIQNIGGTNDMWVQVSGSDAVADQCLRIAPKGSVTFDGAAGNHVPTGRVAVLQHTAATNYVLYHA